MIPIAPVQPRKDSRTHSGILPQKQNFNRKTNKNRKKYFKSREALESEKLKKKKLTHKKQK